MTYIVAVITFPVVKDIVDKNTVGSNFILIILAYILFDCVFPSMGKEAVLGSMSNNFLYRMLLCQQAYVTCFWSGIFFAKENLLVKLYEKMKTEHLLSPVKDIAIWGLVIFLRQIATGGSMDIIYVPLLIVASYDMISGSLVVKRALLEIGRESTNMWLVHSFFCYYFYPFVKIIRAPQYAVLSLLVLIAISYIAALGVTWVWKWIVLCFDKMLVFSRKE